MKYLQSQLLEESLASKLNFCMSLCKGIAHLENWKVYLAFALYYDFFLFLKINCSFLCVCNYVHCFQHCMYFPEAHFKILLFNLFMLIHIALVIHFHCCIVFHSLIAINFSLHSLIWALWLFSLFYVIDNIYMNILDHIQVIS